MSGVSLRLWRLDYADLNIPKHIKVLVKQSYIHFLPTYKNQTGSSKFNNKMSVQFITCAALGMLCQNNHCVCIVISNTIRKFDEEILRDGKFISSVKFS